MAGEAPEVGPVVDVEDDFPPISLGDPDRLVLRRGRAGLREVGARHHDGCGGGDEGLVHVILAKGHVGAVVAIEDERKGVAVTHAENHERGEPLLVGDDAGGLDPFPRQLLQDEAPDLLVTHPRQQGGTSGRDARCRRRCWRGSRRWPC